MPSKRKRIVDSQAAVAKHFGVSLRMVGDWVSRAGCPRRERSDRPGRFRYDLDEIEAWREATSAEAADDPLLRGDGSPALERYREARAKLADLDYRKRVGELIDVAAMHERHVRIAGRLRQAGELLGRKFGVDAQLILDEALEDVEREMLPRDNDDRS